MQNKNMTSLMRKFVIFNFLFSIFFMLAGCNSDNSSSSASQQTDTKQLVAIQVAPQATALPKGTTQEQLPLGLNAQYEATMIYSDGSSQLATDEVAWSTSNDNASVSANGLVTALHSGKVSIQATLDGISSQRTLTIVDALLTNIELAPATTIQLPKGVTLAYKALGYYSDGTNLDITANANWSIGNSAVATINAAGRVTAVAIGTTDITATLDGLSTSGPLEVTAAKLASITLTPANSQLANGLSQTYHARGSFTDGSSVDLTTQANWSSSNPAIASIDTNGLVKAVAAGTTDIHATLAGVSASTPLEITAAKLISLKLTPADGPLAKGLTRQYDAQGVFTDDTRDITASVTWSSSNPSVASIDATGLAAAIDIGTTTITAKLGQISASAKLEVTAATLTGLTLTPANTQLAESFTQQYHAQGTFTDGSQQDITAQVNWNSSNPAVANIDPAGLATAQNTLGTTEIGATLDGISGNVTLEVNATLNAITVTPANTKLAKGTSKAYSVQGTFTDGSRHDITTRVTWSSTNITVATVDAAGLVTAHNAGTTAIDATLNGFSTNSTLEVVPATRVVTWGDSNYGGDSSAVQGQLTDVQTIFSNWYSFAALKIDASVVTWGSSYNGGDSSTVQAQLTGVQTIVGTKLAFAALKRDGGVVTWGDGSTGGDSSAVQTQLTNVQEIVSDYNAFAALKSDGSVVTWGDSIDGGDSSAVQADLTGVQTIVSTGLAFAALKGDGSVVTWGNSNFGGDSSAVQTQLTDVKTLFSSRYAFAALKRDGSVVTWGNNSYGGDSSAMQTQLTGVKTIFSTWYAFAALKNDGSLVTWGHSASGGDSSAVHTQLTDVQTISSTVSAFAALKSDGSVVTWGNSSYGGDSSTVQAQLNAVKTIASTGSAFAALNTDGRVVTWGDSNNGGDSSTVQTQLTGVQTIFNTWNAFAGLKSDGSVVTWGDNLYGGNSSTVQSQLTGVQTIVGNINSFAAIALQ